MRWEDTLEIAQSLEDNYPDEEIPEGDLEFLKEMVLSLNNFEDLEVEVDKSTLREIMEEWLNLRNAN